MASLSDIRSGLAANLAPLKTAGVIRQVSPYLLPSPTPPSAQVAGVDEMTFLDFGATSSAEWTVAIEVALGKYLEEAAWKVLDRLLATSGDESVVAAIEANPTLTSRYDADTGAVTTGQTAACDSLEVSEFAGTSRFTFPNGVELLLARWNVTVIA